MSLANNANSEGFARPSEGEIAWNSCLSVRHVRRTLKPLVKIGVVQICVGGGRKANRYQLNVELLDEMAAAIKRIKDKALQDGVERYAVMDQAACEIRDQLEENARAYAARKADRSSGQSTGWVQEIHPVNHERPHTPDSSSFVLGHHADNADSVSDSTGHGTRRTINEPYKKPSSEPQKEQVQFSVDASRVDSVALARQRAHRIGELATMLSMKDIELIGRASGPGAADEIAQEVISGKIGINQARSKLSVSYIGKKSGPIEPKKAREQ